MRVRSVSNVRTRLGVLAIALALPALTAAQTVPVRVGCRAEWDRPRDILLHVPGEELFFGVIHPNAALFERPFSSAIARREHLQFVARLESLGVRCHTLENLLLAGTLDEDEQPVSGDAIQSLRQLAQASISVTCAGFANPHAEQQAQESYLARTIAQLHPRDLVRIIFLRPHVALRSTGTLNTGYVASYTVDPVMNLYFMRDQLITTHRGIVMGRMNSEQRRIETEIVQFALRKLNLEPLLSITDPGRLEGGDFLPAGDRVFIGQGLRTNAAAISELLERNVFGTTEVVVVKDRWQDQSQMHLDTYFNLISPGLGVIAQARLEPDEAQLRLTADIYRRTGTTYELSRRNIDFVRFLRHDLQMTMIPVSEDDQARYGVNFLNVGDNRILVVEGVSPEYLSRLQGHGVTVETVDFAHLTGGYGACHCIVQVLSREN